MARRGRTIRSRYPQTMAEQHAPRYRTTFVRLLGFLRPYRWSMAISIVLAVGSQAAALALGWLPGNVVEAIRTGIYAKLVRLSFGYYDRHQTGQLMSRATVDLQGVRFFLGYGLIFFFQHIFTIVGVGIVVFLVSWKLALIAIAIGPVLAAVAYRYSHVSHPLLRDVQQKMADVATVAEENIVGVHVVKSFAQEQAEQDKF